MHRPISSAAQGPTSSTQTKPSLTWAQPGAVPSQNATNSPPSVSKPQFSPLGITQSKPYSGVTSAQVESGSMSTGQSSSTICPELQNRSVSPTHSP